MLKDNIPLAVITVVLVGAIIILYREVSSIKASLAQCSVDALNSQFEIASIVPAPSTTEAATDPAAYDAPQENPMQKSGAQPSKLPLKKKLKPVPEEIEPISSS
jgi:hypothetical protein